MYKRKTKLSPIHISLIALAILVVIAVIVTFAVKNDEPKEPTAQSGIVYDDSAIEGGWDLVFVARTRTLRMKSTALRAVMEEQLKKAGVLRGG